MGELTTTLQTRAAAQLNFNLTAERLKPERHLSWIMTGEII
jgi:hypothetical protein